MSTYALPSVHSVRVGATGASLELRLRSAGDEPIDLTNATSLRMQMTNERGEAVLTDGPLTVLNATEGHVLYSYTATELASTGRLFAEINLTITETTDTWGWLGGIVGGWLGLSGGTTGSTTLQTVPTVGAIIIDVV